MEARILLAYTDADVWRFGIGDPTVMGWLTVAAYFFAAFLCSRQFVEERQRRGSFEKLIFWGALAVMLVGLGINKQLDLQTWLTLTGKRIAVAQGWYEKRRIVQALFILLVALGAIYCTLMAQRLVRRNPELRTALVGFVCLAGFVLVRAASFHHVDSLINFRLGGMRMNWMLELGSIGILALGAWKAKNAGWQGGEQDRNWATAR
jgi:hypothetical protein